MPDSNDALPDSVIGRFAAGFGVAAGITFLDLVLILPGCAWKEAALVALFVGCLVGAISAWGNRCLSFFIELLTRYG